MQTEGRDLRPFRYSPNRVRRLDFARTMVSYGPSGIQSWESCARLRWAPSVPQCRGETMSVEQIAFLFPYL